MPVAHLIQSRMQKKHPVVSIFSRSALCCFLMITAGTATLPAQKNGDTPPPIVLDKVWAGHPVGFDFLTTDHYQYAAYYNAERQMVVARRKPESDQWQKTILPSVLGWDSHNYVTIAADSEGFLHVSGNMHGHPLVYFRSVKPWEIEEFAALPMTEKNENRVTYPVFFKDPAGQLYFQYRNGGSGDGITFWNRYDTASKTWEGVFDTPIFDGEKEANAYMTNPRLGPDGYFYIVWMWRLTPIANTNHNLSCMRSKDFLLWENMRGEKIQIPARWSDDLAVVDPVAPWNGLINMGFNISWDDGKVPYITYHKYDGAGVSQVYISRWEQTSGRWKNYQISDWTDFKWSLNKAGSLTNSIWISTIRPTGKNEISANYFHEQYGEGSWTLDKSTLQIKTQTATTENADLTHLPPMELKEGMSLRQRKDNTGKYSMRWQTLPTNQDRPRPGPLPEPVDLVIYQLKE